MKRVACYIVPVHQNAHISACYVTQTALAFKYWLH
jgi:hypothetical protein